ncbi:uncharacterized protein TNCV_2178161 [Trichonephila clavipes]|uniref:Uncharacterized protein n=1 Tax=Trichonephila clavipes TaxID=2585209 RepID=A0A8X6VUA6_TRICX|nr:uncharacterized protein TNCV_2178161 [Trichonephila clavipes]
MFKEDNSFLCHKVGHDAHTRDVINENITTAMCGVKSDCPFNKLGYWHVTNNLVVDVMHDLMEGDKVPYNNDFWNLYLLMLTIFDTLMAPVISLPETYALAENIADHHKLFLILFPNRHLTPKMHFALHYPRIIRQLGPPVSPGVRGAPANGFIADIFKNFRARNLSVVEKELDKGKINRNIKEKTQKYQGTEDSFVEFLQKQQ